MSGIAATQADAGTTKSAGEGQVLGIYHLNINVTNLERSRAFYELFGFRVVDTFHERHNAALDRGLGLPHGTNSENHALFMMVGGFLAACDRRFRVKAGIRDPEPAIAQGAPAVAAATRPGASA